MNVALSGWLLSFMGAALFFAAGHLWAFRRNLARAASASAELGRTRAERDRLRTTLRELEQGALADARRERDRLRADFGKAEQVAREASARANAHLREVDELLAELRSKHKPRRSAPVTLDAGARGDELRTILDRETSGNGFTGAVIADELGLIVASTGEFGDALAAYGAFLAGVGAKTRGVLPLQALRQLVIQDDYDATLTVRPIVSADDQLALVTLAPGRGLRAGAGASTERSS